MPQTSRKHGTAIIFVLLAALCALVALGLAACTNDEVVTNSYKTLKIAADTYDGCMRSVADLYSRGEVDDQVRDQAIDLGTKFQMAYQAGSIALEAYATAVASRDAAGASGQKVKLDTALAEMAKLLGALSDLLAPHGKQQAEWAAPDGLSVTVNGAALAAAI